MRVFFFKFYLSIIVAAALLSGCASKLPEELPEVISCAIEKGYAGTASEDMCLEYHVSNREEVIAECDFLTEQEIDEFLKDTQMVILLEAKGLPPEEQFVLCSIASNNTITELAEWATTSEGESLKKILVF